MGTMSDRVLGLSDPVPRRGGLSSDHRRRVIRLVLGLSAPLPPPLTCLVCVRKPNGGAAGAIETHTLLLFKSEEVTQ